jgi:chorismate mutase/prephenate dehydratase
VLKRVLAASEGPLPDRTIEGIYRELMSGSFALEQPLRIGYLGPAGSYSHMAAVKHFGSSVEFEDLREIAGVFTEVQRGHVQYGLVPIENSTGGGIVETLDAFLDDRTNVHLRRGADRGAPRAAGELRAQGCAEDPQQARGFQPVPRVAGDAVPAGGIDPGREFEPFGPDRGGGEPRPRGRSARRPGRRRSARELAGEIYGLNVLFEKIEDNPSNITRFFVISRHAAQRSGDDKTSIMFTTDDKPGALVSVLSVFHHAGINLSHIDKRPSGRENWAYTFFVDAVGHLEDQDMQFALARARAHCKELHVLGSYPRSRRIL